MSEPTNPQAATPAKRPRSAKGQSARGTKTTMQQTAALSRPAPDDREEWKKYWEAQGLPWRTEPGIDEERQRFLAERRAIQPDIEKGIYSFKDMKLSRADVEWLLATHEEGRGPIDWSDLSQRGRLGIDLRGADLKGEDLRELPLTQMRDGLLPWSRGGSRDEWFAATHDQQEKAGVHLEGAVLSYTHMEGATLSNAHLEGAKLESAHLEGARLRESHLQGASLNGAYLDPSTHLYRIRLADQVHRSLSLADVSQVGRCQPCADRLGAAEGRRK